MTRHFASNMIDEYFNMTSYFISDPHPYQPRNTITTREPTGHGMFFFIIYYSRRQTYTLFKTKKTICCNIHDICFPLLKGNHTIVYTYRSRCRYSFVNNYDVAVFDSVVNVAVYKRVVGRDVRLQQEK